MRSWAGSSSGVVAGCAGRWDRGSDARGGPGVGPDDLGGVAGRATGRLQVATRGLLGTVGAVAGLGSVRRLGSARRPQRTTGRLEPRCFGQRIPPQEPVRLGQQRRARAAGRKAPRRPPRSWRRRDGEAGGGQARRPGRSRAPGPARSPTGRNAPSAGPRTSGAASSTGWREPVAGSAKGKSEQLVHAPPERARPRVRCGGRRPWRPGVRVKGRLRTSTPTSRDGQDRRLRVEAANVRCTRGHDD